MMQPPNIILVLSVLKKVYFFVHVNSGLYKTLDKTRYILRDETNVKLEKTRILHHFLV